MPIELTISSVFLIAYLVIGLWPNGEKSTREYFLISNRSLGPLASGFSIAASKIGSGLLVIYSALVFEYGYEALWLFGSYILGYAGFYIFAKKLYREGHASQFYTMADYFHHNFNKPLGVVIGLLTTLSQAGWIITNLVAGGVLLSELTGLSSISTTIAMSAVIGLYLIAGGFNSVIRTDVVQYIALMLIAILISIVFMTTPPSDGLLIEPHTSQGIPIGRIVSFIFLGLLFPFGSAELWQRAYATRSEKAFRGGVAIAAISFVAIGLVLTKICLSLRSGLQFDSPEDQQLALVLETANQLSPWLAGLWFVAFGSAVLSSADTFIFTTASAAVEDVFERMGWTDAQHRIKWMRLAIAIACVAGTLMAVLVADIVDVTLYFAGITMTLGLIALVARFIPKISPSLLIAAALTGVGLATLHALLIGISTITLLVNFGGALAVIAAALGGIVILKGVFAAVGFIRSPFCNDK